MHCLNDSEDWRSYSNEQLFRIQSSGVPLRVPCTQPIADSVHLPLWVGNESDPLSPDISPAIKSEIQAILFERLYPPLVNYLLRRGLDSDDAEDAVQEKLIYVLIENPGCYDPDKGELLNFLYRCVANLAINNGKHKARHCGFDESLDKSCAEDSALQLLFEKIVFDQVVAHAQFTAQEKQVLHCWRRGSTKAGDIAVELGISSASVSRILYEIRKKIEAIWFK